MNQVHMVTNVVNGRKVVGAFRSFENVRSLQLECVPALHEDLIPPVFMYGSKTVV